MANPIITQEPKKDINGFESKWNAAALPIQYTIENDKFPVKDGIYPPDVTNYRTEIDIYVNGSLIGTIKQIPDSNNQTKVDIRKYVQTVLKYEQNPSVFVDDNAWCEFYIEGTEEYIDSGGTPQSNTIDNSGEIFYASLSSLQFGNESGGNMYDYVIDPLKTDLAQWLTTFERGKITDITQYELSIISNNIGFDLEAIQYDINGNMLSQNSTTIPNEGYGLYRVGVSFIAFEEDVNYITIQAQDYTGTPLSELAFIDIDIACQVTSAAPILSASIKEGTSDTIILNWVSDGENFSLERKEYDEPDSSYVVIATQTGKTYEDSGLTENTKFTYRVRVTSPELSDYSNEASELTIPDFSSALMGYSVRRIGRDAVNFVTIRRDSDNAETDWLLPEVGFVSLDDEVTAGGTVGDWVGANNAFVDRIYDQVGSINLNDSNVQSFQPRIIGAGVLDLENAVAAINTVAVLNSQLTRQVPITEIDKANDFTWYAITTNRQPANNTGTIWGTNYSGTGGINALRQNKPSPDNAVFSMTDTGSTSAVSRDSTGPISTAVQVLTFGENDATAEEISSWQNLNAGSVESTAGLGSVPVTSFRIMRQQSGTPVSLTGTFQEMVFWDALITTDERELYRDHGISTFNIP